MSVFGQCPKSTTIQVSGGSSTPETNVTFFNPRATVYFYDNPPETGTIGAGVNYSISGDIIRRGEFSPAFGAGGWTGGPHIPFTYLGTELIDVTIEAFINVGRQANAEVDVEIFSKIDGVETGNRIQQASISRSPPGNQGGTTIHWTGYATLFTNNTVEILLRRVGADAGTSTQINVFSAMVNIYAVEHKQLPVDTVVSPVAGWS